MSDPINELKEIEKAKLKEQEIAQLKASQPNARSSTRIGLALIVVGLVALGLVLSGVNVWSYWWLIFFVKPFFFGFGRWGYASGCRRQATAANSVSNPSDR